MPIKIICNGKVTDTKIIDTESGVELQNITKVHIILDGENPFRRPEAILHFTDVKLEVTADVIKTIPPTGLTFKRAKTA